MEELFLWIRNLISREFAIFIAAMLPVTELRGAIPLAVSWGISPMQAFWLAFIGNLVPVMPLLILLDPVTELLRKVPIFDRFFEWLYARTLRKSDRVKKYGAIGLIFFTAVPLPTTGAWTASLAATIFKIRFKWAFLAISTGVLIAGIAITLLSAGIITVF
ncbi:COG2426 family protein [Fuchsiella alkaliacetigena]|uniref:COG2426 family protein n=1 Tax=Fuchsiella alkaliacetigena TaxID=957042 RepID=UPI00200B0854|nr:small multi-drug export protein [Fuchsiella alkaliacetigena]MCK8825891.1 small multi-drug export protein [Fuchsiella alkaliacetigena]